MSMFVLKEKSCTIVCKTSYIDSKLAGATDELITGYYNFYIPTEHYKGLVEFYGRDNYKFDWSQMESDVVGKYPYYSNSADELIYFLHYLIRTHKGQYILDIETDNTMWVVHDFYHAKFDIHYKDFKCDLYTEVIRVRQALSFMKRKNLRRDGDYIRSWIGEFNTRRMGCDYMRNRGSLTYGKLMRYKRIQYVDI